MEQNTATSTPVQTQVAQPAAQRQVTRWSADEWQKFSDACYSIIKPLVDEGKPTSLDIRGVLEAAQDTAITDVDRRRTADAIRTSTPFIRYFNRFGLSPEVCTQLVSKRVSQLDLNMDSTPNMFAEPSRRVTKWSPETMRTVADEYLKLANENPALNRYDVLQIAMTNVLPEELHRNKYSAWASLNTSGVLAGVSRQRSHRSEPQPQPQQAPQTTPQPTSPGGVEVCMSAPPPKSRDSSPVTLEQIEAAFTSTVSAAVSVAMQPIELELVKLHNRIDAVGRQAGMVIGLSKDLIEEIKSVSMQTGIVGSNTAILTQNLESANGRLTRIIKRLRLIGPDENWENDVREMLENVLGKVADIEELVSDGR